MVERKSGRTLDHLGHLLDTGDYHVVLVDGAEVRVEEGEVVRIEQIDNAEYVVADVQRAADLVKQHPELRLVVLVEPHCSTWIPDFPIP